VDPVHSSAFDLPDSLSRKADPALIAGDEQHFAAIATTLEHSIADLSDRSMPSSRRPRVEARRRWTGIWRSTGSTLACAS